MKYELKVKGMHCASCETIVKEGLEEAGAARVHASHKDGRVVVESDTLDEKKAREIIEAEGYAVE